MKDPERLKIAYLLTFFALFGLVVATITDNPFWFNLALNRTATQSSTATNGEAKKAVDGKGYPRPDRCAKTEESTNPYIVIDLREDSFPTYIRVAIDFENVHAESLTSVSVRLGNNADHSLNDVISSRFIWRAIDHLIVGRRGRYLSVDVEQTTVLSICEIYAVVLPLDQIGYGKPVDSSIHDTSSGSNLKLDKLTDHSIGMPTLTSWTENPWIRVDLEDSFYIREVIVFASALVDINNFAIRIGHSLIDNGRSNPLCAEHQNITTAGGQAFFCRMKGRYIVLTKDSKTRIRLQVTELLVNPTRQKNHAESLIPVIFPTQTMALSGYVWLPHLTNNVPEPGGYITVVGTTGIWLRLDLGAAISVGKIIIAAVVPTEYHDQLIDFELRVGDSLDNNGNSNPLCLDNLQSMLGKKIESFFCEPPITGQYVNLNQKTTDKHLALSEIAVYSEYEPKIKNRLKGRQIWIGLGETIALSCSAHGQPAPIISWIRDGVALKTGSNTLPLEITTATSNDSGTYECWANNTHGDEYMPFHVNVTSDLRPCAESLEIELAVEKSGISYPASETEIRGNKWYRFYDGGSKNYLKLDDKTPKRGSTCNTWISGSHPDHTADAVVKKYLCVKENDTRCNHRYDVRIRNCLGYYIYNLPWSRETTNVVYCFKSDNEVRPTPTISMKVKANHALFNHVFQTEEDVKDSSQCMIMCSLTDRCKSYNFSDKEGKCELNSSTKQKHSSDFLPRNGYDYFMKGKGLVSNRLGEL